MRGDGEDEDASRRLRPKHLWRAVSCWIGTGGREPLDLLIGGRERLDLLIGEGCRRDSGTAKIKRKCFSHNGLLLNISLGESETAQEGLFNSVRQRTGPFDGEIGKWILSDDELAIHKVFRFIFLS